MFAIGIARNTLIDHFRTRHPASELYGLDEILADSSPSALEELIAHERLDQLRMLVTRLDSESRELLAFRYGDGFSHAEISRLTGATEAAVRQRISRSLRAIRESAASAEGGANSKGELSHVR